MSTELPLDIIVPAWGDYVGTLARALASTPGGARRIAVVDPAERARAIAAGADVVVDRPPGGVAAARERGMDAAERPFVMFLDSDDELRSGGPEALLEMLERDERLVAAAGSMQCRTDGRVWPPPMMARRACGSFGLALLLARNVLPAAGACVIRRALLPATPLFPPLEDEDWHASVALRAAGPVDFTEAVILDYDDHPGSLSRRPRNVALLRRSRSQLLEAVERARGPSVMWRVVDALLSPYRAKRDRRLVERWGTTS